eukprot:15480938-Alexandrium_andersonii.AAC.1
MSAFIAARLLLGRPWCVCRPARVIARARCVKTEGLLHIPFGMSLRSLGFLRTSGVRRAIGVPSVAFSPCVRTCGRATDAKS